ncbi:MAG: glycerol-3-phosphate dehydrogenase [Pseudohongiellaceae bacterium]|nr:glycerol-3-phosphate dehydrogenase [Pseudohongiellaceae bacterium]
MNQLSPIHDLLIIGGGINGTGIAADAAGRGLNVVLCEMNDLASGTSSASTKLIHGGLRYLEQYEFRLVREALGEREVLLHNAPHLIKPMRFRLPHMPHLRPKWMIRAGLFLYDSLSRRVTLPGSRGIKFNDSDPLVESLKDGFEYSDAWVDDSRLVVTLAQCAREKSADIRVRSKCVGVSAQNNMWRVELKNEITGELETVLARCIVNASGPWVGQSFDGSQMAYKHRDVRLVKGCHIVVPRMHAGEESYMLQNDDGRVVFVIPYEHDFTLIGTTDEDFTGDPSEAEISEREKDYLINIVNTYFRKQISSADVLHSFAGVRPLLDDGEGSASEVSRDYTLDMDTSEAPLLTVYGGKITTYRCLAESAMEELEKIFPQMGGPWTQTEVLPGSQFESPSQLLDELTKRFSWASSEQLCRWASSYGSCTYKMLEGVDCAADLGEDFGFGLSAREVDYMCEQEWAFSVDDILWRRSKLGLRLEPLQVAKLEGYLLGRKKAITAAWTYT